MEFSESQINKIMHFRPVIRNRQSDDMTNIGKSKMHNQKRLFPPKKSRLKSIISFYWSRRRTIKSCGWMKTGSFCRIFTRASARTLWWLLDIFSAQNYSHFVFRQPLVDKFFHKTIKFKNVTNIIKLYSLFSINTSVNFYREIIYQKYCLLKFCF